jgi:integrase
LRWLKKRGCYYITWTEHGRSRERSTGTADRCQAEIIFVHWLQARRRRDGPRDPSEILVTDVLADYARQREAKVSAPRIGCAIDALLPFWEGRVVGDVTPRTCGAYERHRAPCLPGTVRRELGVLQAAINLSNENGDLTRTVKVLLPEKPEPRDRWLTPDQVARLIRAARTPQARLYLPLFIVIAIYAGRRKGAILSLRWPQVDLERGFIDFEQGKPTRSGRAKSRSRRNCWATFAAPDAAGPI